MRVLDVSEIKLEWSDLTRLTPHPAQEPYYSPPNTIGVATIVRYIGRELGKYGPDDRDDDAPWRVLMGIGWETMCAQLYPAMNWQPGVLELDGVCGHPDGWSELLPPPARGPWIDSIQVTDEFKYTAKSLRVRGGQPDQHKSITDEWAWMCQVMGYIRMRPDWEYLDRCLGRFHICWAMGNYTRHTLDERYMRYLVEFERAEVERNWAMLVKYRGAAMAEVGHGK